MKPVVVLPYQGFSSAFGRVRHTRQDFRMKYYLDRGRKNEFDYGGLIVFARSVIAVLVGNWARAAPAAEYNRWGRPHFKL